MKKLIILILVLFTTNVFAGDLREKIIAKKKSLPVGYCAGISWNTLSDFALDFDNDTPEQACEDGVNGEIGVKTSATIVTPSTVSPLSGGDALLSNASTEYIDFDNTNSFFASVYGEGYFSVKLDGNNIATYYIIKFEGVSGQDKLIFQIVDTGALTAVWEDNNDGNVTLSGLDLDSYYGDWVQVHFKWDTTRCDDGADTCSGAGEDELCFRVRVDDNRDQDFGDGGAEDWTSFYCEVDIHDFEAWASEPGSGQIVYGLYAGAHSEDLSIDDVEVSTSKPSW